MRLMDVATVPAFHAPPAPGAPERFLGAAVVGTEPFYVHVWAPQRTTLRAKDIQSAVELAEVAEDAGAELGRLHGRAGDGEAHRALLKRAVDSIRGDLPVAAVELAGQFTRAWRAYLKESNQVAWTRAPRRPAAAAVDGGASVDAGAPPDAGP
jgi:hypothetical protein